MIHSPPLLSGVSFIIPTSANSEHTLRMGRCLITRAESSFSLCSGAKCAREARGGALIAVLRCDTKAGVKEDGKRRCRSDMICASGGSISACEIKYDMHLHSTPNVFLSLTTSKTFDDRAC